MSKIQALSLRAQWLGDRLRAARERAGFTLKDAGAYLGLDFTMIGKFELGRNPIRPSYVRDLISYYGISDERERAALLKLQEDAWRKDWWDGDTGDLETGFLDYTWLEARAAHIHVYEPLLINGLLQTEDYMRAMADAGMPQAPTSEVDRMVELRLQRTNILQGDDPTQLTVIFEECALRRIIGDAAVMAGQLRHLLDVTIQENVVIQVLPTAIGWHAGLHGPFTYFDMRDPLPDVAYTESMAGRTFLEDESKVDRHRRAHAQLSAAAQSPGQSRKFLTTLLKDLR